MNQSLKKEGDMILLTKLTGCMKSWSGCTPTHATHTVCSVPVAVRTLKNIASTNKMCKVYKVQNKVL